MSKDEIISELCDMLDKTYGYGRKISGVVQLSDGSVYRIPQREGRMEAEERK